MVWGDRLWLKLWDLGVKGEMWCVIKKCMKYLEVRLEGEKSALLVFLTRMSQVPIRNLVRYGSFVRLSYKNHNLHYVKHIRTSLLRPT